MVLRDKMKDRNEKKTQGNEGKKRRRKERKIKVKAVHERRRGE